MEKPDCMRVRMFKILHGLDLRAALQNIEQLMQLNEIFHTYLELFAKGVRKRRDCKRSVKISTRVRILLCFSSRLCENQNLYNRQPRTQKNLYYTVTDAIVLSIFLRELLYQHQFNGFDWLLMTIYGTKLVHS